MADPTSDEIAVALRIALKHPLEVSEVFGDSAGDKICGTSPRFGLLVLVIEARGNRVMHVVRFVDNIGDRQLQLMCPEPPGLVARREAMAGAEVEKDVCGLRNQDIAVF